MDISIFPTDDFLESKTTIFAYAMNISSLNNIFPANKSNTHMGLQLLCMFHRLWYSWIDNMCVVCGMILKLVDFACAYWIASLREVNCMRSFLRRDFCFSFGFGENFSCSHNYYIYFVRWYQIDSNHLQRSQWYSLIESLKQI